MTNITTENCAALLDILREKNPLVHCITNYVTANTVANGLLAAGASPVMADSPLDAEDITAKASAVLFNMGTLSKDRLRAMLISAQKAADMAKPIVLDPVGAGSTDNRLRSTMAASAPVQIRRSKRQRFRNIRTAFDKPHYDEGGKGCGQRRNNA